MNAPVRISQPVASFNDHTGIGLASKGPERRKDRVLPILIVGSLIVHLLIFLPSLLSHDADKASVPHEIPVEVVQEPPAPPAPKPPPQAPPKKEATKPAQLPKPASEPKPEAPKVQAPKVQAPQSEAPKTEPQKSPAKAARDKPADSAKPTGGEQRMKDLLGPMPAVALPGAAADGTDEVSYEQLVLSKVSKAKKEGRFQGRPANASVSFHLDDTGAVTSVTLVRPSGEKFVDDEAVAMVRRGEPYLIQAPGCKVYYTITLRFMAYP